MFDALLQAGARKVYAIEASGMAEHAKVRIAARCFHISYLVILLSRRLSVYALH